MKFEDEEVVEAIREDRADARPALLASLRGEEFEKLGGEEVVEVSMDDRAEERNAPIASIRDEADAKYEAWRAGLLRDYGKEEFEESWSPMGSRVRRPWRPWRS